MSFRETGIERYLNQAENIADYILNHPNLPTDKVPYWDFNDPEIPDTYRDASAGAIIASALLELSRYVENNEKAKNYQNSALDIMLTLSQDRFLAEEGTNGNFLLKHSVGSIPHNSEVDVPLTYADYYYIEAIMRYIDMRDNGMLN
jgi:rhamnogalacturonyl hydrolase YesR